MTACICTFVQTCESEVNKHISSSREGVRGQLTVGIRNWSRETAVGVSKKIIWANTHKTRYLALNASLITMHICWCHWTNNNSILTHTCPTGWTCVSVAMINRSPLVWKINCSWGDLHQIFILNYIMTKAYIQFSYYILFILK